MLSNALLVTWAGGHGARLTLADYHASGGVATAVDALAEQVYASLDVEEQDATRVLFLRLLRVSADLVTREPLPLAGLDPRQRAGLDAFAAARMLTISGGIVRISHDALLDHWSRLHDWVEESRSDLDVLTKLRRAAQVWADSGREDDALIPVRRLAVFSPWLADADRRELLSAQEREFLAASEAHLTTLLEAEQANSMRLRRRGSLAIALAALATAFALFAGFLIAHGQVLQAQAVAARDDAQSRQVATAARLLRGTDPNLLTQMALVASRIADTEEGRSILLDATAVDAGSRWAGTPSAVVALSADENLLVRAAGAGEVTLWRGEEIGASAGATVAVDPLAGPLYAVALTRVGGRDLLAVGGESVRALWDVTGEPVHLADFESDGQTAFAAAFDADGATLALGTSAGEVQLWDVADPGHPVLSATVALDQPADTTVRPGVTSVVVGADRILYASGALGSINRWRLGGSPTPLPSLDASLATDEAPARPVMVQTMALSPDGTRLAAGLAARGVLRWQVSGEQVTPLEPLRGFGSYVNDVSFSADGTWLVTASSDQDVAVHDAATGEELRRVTMPALATGAVLSRGRPIAAGSDGMLRVWPLTSPAWRIGGSAVYNLATDGREDGWLAAGTFTDGTVLWRLGADAPVRMPTPVVTLADGDRQRGAAAVAPSGGYLVGASARGSVLSWPLSDEGAGEVRVTPTDLDNVAVTVVSPDSSLVAALEYTGARTALFAATADGVLTQVATLDSPRPQYAAFLDGGAVLAVAVAAKRVDLWSVADPSHPVLAGRIEGFSTWPTAVAADATGTLVAVGEDSGHVSVWNVADPAEPRRVRVYTQARSAVYSLAFRADGHQLVGAGGDNLVWGWDLASPSTEAQFALRGELDRPWDVRYLGDGARLAVGSNDGTVRVWLTDPDAARRALCAGRGEPMTSEEWDTNLNGVTPEDPC